MRVGAPRFALFMALFAVASPLAGLTLGAGRGLLVGFDLASLVFLLSVAPIMGTADQGRMREMSARNDANRWLTLGLGVVTLLVITLAVGIELTGRAKSSVALAGGTLLCAWLFGNTFFALHYAHLYYDVDDDAGAGGGDRKGLDFPGHEEPTYLDFLYFSFVLGMTFQVSDVDITSRVFRQTALLHSVVSFLFNIGVVALSVSVVAGALGH